MRLVAGLPTASQWMAVVVGLLFVATPPAGAQTPPSGRPLIFPNMNPPQTMPSRTSRGQIDWNANGFRNDPLSDAVFPGQPVVEPDPVGSAESRGPIIPEPMVFDLVRPLGARKGELEVNMLGLVPLRRFEGAPRFEYAPEIEFAVVDNFALEFELPMADGNLEAYKFAAQYTFGHAFEERFIHGTQALVEYDIDRRGTILVLLYLWGIRFDDDWSMLGMVGARTEFAPESFGRRTGFLVDPLELAPEATTVGTQGSRTETLLNLTLFRELNERWTMGFEANYARGMEGEGSLLLIPQAQWQISRNWEFQFGLGSQSVSGSTIGVGAFRLIWAN